MRYREYYAVTRETSDTYRVRRVRETWLRGIAGKQKTLLIDHSLRASWGSKEYCEKVVRGMQNEQNTPWQVRP